MIHIYPTELTGLLDGENSDRSVTNKIGGGVTVYSNNKVANLSLCILAVMTSLPT